MKIFFSYPQNNKDDNNTAEVLRIIDEQGHELTFQRTKYQRIHATNLKFVNQGIDSADLVILDGNVDDGAIGYKLALAIAKSKKIIVYRNESLDAQDFILGSKSGSIRYVKYRGDDFTEKLTKAIDKLADVGRVRFNLNLEYDLYEFVHRKASEDNTTKTQVIQDALTLYRDSLN